MQCSGMQGLYARLTGEGPISLLYIYMQCNGMQGCYAQLTGEDLSPFYIYIEAV